MTARVRKGDQVAVMSGNDRGKRGRVLRVIHDKQRVVVQGVNVVFKHLRKSQKNPQGGRIRREAPIHLSNVMPIDPETNKPTKVAVTQKDGKNVRVARGSGTRLDAEVTASKKAGKKDSKKGKKE